MGEILVWWWARGTKTNISECLLCADTVPGALHMLFYFCLPVTWWIRNDYSWFTSTFGVREVRIISVVTDKSLPDPKYMLLFSYQGKHVSGKVDLPVEWWRRAPKSGHVFWQCCVHTSYTMLTIALCLKKMLTKPIPRGSVTLFACLGLVRQDSSYKWLHFKF